MTQLQNGSNFRKLFDVMQEGLAFCRLIYDSMGAAIDWQYLDVNQSFDKLTGLRDVVGKKVSEIIPGIHLTNPELLEIYARVAKTGVPEKFRTYVPQLNIWFKVVAYSVEPHTFVAVFENITERQHDRTAILEVLSRALDVRDEDTEQHTRRVADQTVTLCRIMGMPDIEVARARWGALLHDAGKLAVPDSILLKEGGLTDDEWKVMRKHPEYARDMFSQITFLKDALDIPYLHHENWDGSGYPLGLKGEQIPLAVRIFSVIDTLDALTNNRPYRKAVSKEKAVEHIREQTGKKFDPEVVEKFIKMLENHKQ